MTILLDDGLIQHDDVIVDLGSGTGEVVFTCSFIFGMKAVGIEFDDMLHNYSQDILKQINEEEGTLEANLIRGDYTRYDELSEMSNLIIYNYLSGNIGDILSSVKRGTKFLSFLGVHKSDRIFTRNKGRHIYRRLYSNDQHSFNRFIRRRKMVKETLSKYKGWELIKEPGNGFQLWVKH